MSFEILLSDLRAILTDFRLQDLGVPVFWGMWLSILFASLRGVDRREEITQVTYVAVVAAMGVFLLFMFPLGRKPVYSVHAQILIFLLILTAPSVRWLIKRRDSELDRRIRTVLTVGKSKK